jgi:hypothetical protein
LEQKHKKKNNNNNNRTKQSSTTQEEKAKEEKGDKADKAPRRLIGQGFCPTPARADRE